jgi:hypothetical protein
MGSWSLPFAKSKWPEVRAGAVGVRGDGISESRNFGLLGAAWGQCYDNYFLQILKIFRRKKWRFYEQPML